MRTLHFKVEGMSCEKCSARVSQAIVGIHDFPDVTVDHQDGAASVALGDELAKSSKKSDKIARQIEQKLAEIGYPATLEAPASLESAARPKSDAPETSAPKTSAPKSAAEEPQTTSRESDGPEVRIDVGGMTCASCVAGVEKALERVEGVEQVRVNLATERASVKLRAPATDIDRDLDALRDAVESVGYEVRDIQPVGVAAPAAIQRADSALARRSAQPASLQRPDISERRAEEARAWKLRWVTGLILTAPILFLQMGPMWFELQLGAGANIGRLAATAYLTTIVFAFVGKPYLLGAWKRLKHFDANMDTLVAMGASVAWGFSMVVTVAALLGTTLAQGRVYFDSAAMILTLISVGKWLEARAKGRAGEAIEALLNLGATTARVRRVAAWGAFDGGSAKDEWIEIPADQIQPGDEMLVKPGEKIPTDGVIIEGRADVDASMITGESVPVARGVDDEVIGSTINTDGRLVVRATRVGGETALAQIIDLVEKAQESKADVQRLADKISSIFVPAIIVIAVATLVLWMLVEANLALAILPTIAVLIVACPCALGLATPTALMVGTGKAAGLGILIRDAQALEQAGHIDAIIFDKTGTLTTGEMAVSDVRARIDEEEFIRLGASLEAASEHPIGAAVIRLAAERGLAATQVDDFRSVAGEGVTGSIDGRNLRIGKPSWILGADEDRGVSEKQIEEIENLQQAGKTVVALADDDHLLGLFGVRDQVKDESARTIEWLASRGIEVWMITGDNAQTAEAVAAEIGIAPERVKAGVRPQDKAQAVQDLQKPAQSPAHASKQTRAVAMVGDGINDAPALAQADLGIAIGTGTDVAIEASDITLISGDIKGVRRAVELSRATYAKIKQNLFWAFIYNVILVPIAALGLLIPALAAGAMALSSVSVVSNSVLLKRRKID
jgi:Cu+-exporting ATPase